MSIDKHIAGALNLPSSFRQLFGSSPSAIAISRLSDDVFVEVNRSFINLFGCSFDDVVGHTGSEFDLWNDPQKWTQIIRQLSVEGYVHNFPVGYRQKSGEIGYALASVNSFDVDGITYLISFFTKTNDHVAKEAQLPRTRNADSEIRYRSLFESMNTGFVLFEAVLNDQGIAVDLTILAANKWFEKTTGLSIEQVIGRRLTEVLPGIENDPADWIGTYGRIAQTGAAQTFERGSQLLGIYYAVSAYQAGPNQCAVTFQDITDRKHAETELKASEQLLKFALEGSREGVWEADLVTDKIKVSKRFEQILGYAEGEFGNDRTRWQERIHPDDVAIALSTLDAYLSGDIDVYHNEYRMMCKNGEYKWLLGRGMITDRAADGSAIRMVGTLTDISDSKQVENRLRIASIAFESQEGMVVTAADGVILNVNRAFTRITGYTSEEAIGNRMNLLQSGRHGPEFYVAMWDNIRKFGFWEGEIWNKRKNGEIYPETLTISAVKNAAGNVSNYVGTLTDITLNKKSADEIERMAFYDSLTGLPNRRLLQDRLKQAIASNVRTGKTGAVLFIDLDSFKTINDTLGHAVGDQLLQQVGRRIQSCLREVDTVSRPGGDEFIVMLSDLSEHEIEAAQQAEGVTSKIIAVLNQDYQLDHHHFHNTASIGISLFGGVQHSIDEVMRHADMAMYQAKKEGKNRGRFFDPKMQEVINSRADLENELWTAVQQQQFQLYYQVQTDCAKQVIGAEALIRWSHPDRGMVTPAGFIPIAEETGVILDMGRWVLLNACRQIKKWEQSALTSGLVIAVNVSARQFHQNDFVSEVKQAIEQTRIDPTRLKIELTESMLVENMEATLLKMQQLKAIGITLSLDDFGTGYSSLRYLQALPIDQLKIDQSFVQNIYTNEGNRDIVQTIIQMALGLKMDLIAEGVETEQQREFLDQHGCKKFQGYLFGKPMPIEQFEAALTSR